MSQGEEIHTINTLLQQWMSREDLSEESQARLQQWAKVSPENQLLLDQLQDDDWLGEEVGKMNAVDTERHWQSITPLLHRDKATTNRRVPAERPLPIEMPVPVRRINHWKTTRIAAAVFLLAAAGLALGKWWGQSPQPALASADPVLTPDGITAAASATKATLTLDDGAVIALDNTVTGQLTEQAGIRVMKEGRRLVYDYAADKRNKNTKTTYHTLTVPRGMQFELVLTDGTKILLNNASSLRYPVTFTGDERKLTLTGEAYFEVAQAAGRPFRVQTPSMLTDVLGTHFNIRDYPDELAPRTTLLEGSVAVHKGSESVLLKRPGEEVQVQTGGSSLRVTAIDPESRMAWKNGFFYLDSLDIRASLREVARWYHKDIRFGAGVETVQLMGGQAKRDQPITTLLRHLERTDLHFRFQGTDSIIIVSR